MTTAHAPTDGPRPERDSHSAIYGRLASAHNHHPVPNSGHDFAGDSGHTGHGWMMMICCVPMLLIAGVLVATGVAGSGLVLSALLCTAMMAAMMFMMPGGHGGHGPS